MQNTNNLFDPSDGLHTFNFTARSVLATDAYESRNLTAAKSSARKHSLKPFIHALIRTSHIYARVKLGKLVLPSRCSYATSSVCAPRSCGLLHGLGSHSCLMPWAVRS